MVLNCLKACSKNFPTSTQPACFLGDWSPTGTRALSRDFALGWHSGKALLQTLGAFWSRFYITSGIKDNDQPL